MLVAAIPISNSRQSRIYRDARHEPGMAAYNIAADFAIGIMPDWEEIPQ
jgi:hypothetical protein